MKTTLRKLLSTYRQAALSERDKGTCFEKLATVFLKYGSVMKSKFEDMRLFANWAVAQALNAKKIGIVVVKSGENRCV